MNIDENKKLGPDKVKGTIIEITAQLMVQLPAPVLLIKHAAASLNPS